MQVKDQTDRKGRVLEPPSSEGGQGIDKKQEAGRSKENLQLFALKKLFEGLLSLL